MSLDVSASSTGWSCINEQDVLCFGTIQPAKNLDVTHKLDFFRTELKKLFIKFKPTYVVLEDTFLGNNPKVVKLLAKFGGVAEQAIFEYCKITPYLMGNTTPKSFFKVPTKERLFAIMIDLVEFNIEMIFKNHNDITDSVAQLFCYCDEILKLKEVRMEKDYGYKYKFSSIRVQ